MNSINADKIIPVKIQSIFVQLTQKIDVRIDLLKYCSSYNFRTS